MQQLKEIKEFNDENNYKFLYQQKVTENYNILNELNEKLTEISVLERKL